MKYGEIIPDNLKKAGWSYGYVSGVDSNGQTIWIADAHTGDRKRCLEKEHERYCDHGRTARAPIHQKTYPSTRKAALFYRTASDKQSQKS